MSVLATHPPWPNLRGVHAFVVDDNDDSRRLLDQALHYCGALVTVFASPEAALEALTEYLPTLIISDISMPEMTGFEFIRRLRERPPDKGGRIPAIAVTAFYEDFVAGAARNAGFDAYLTKPINFESLCALVDHVVGLKRQRDTTAA
jgi:CheY-like chemotaxis protein